MDAAQARECCACRVARQRQGLPTDGPRTLRRISCFQYIVYSFRPISEVCCAQRYPAADAVSFHHTSHEDISYNSQHQSTSMADHSLAIHRDGIYHGLPVLPADDTLQGLSAIVVGASGMSGQSMIDNLAKDARRWKKVYALSRRPPQLSVGTTNVEHIRVDLLDEPADIAQTLSKSGVTA